MTSFGERLKQLMEDQSISQRDLAAALNISKSTVSGYVNSYREPDFKSLLEIASIFHVTTDYLLGNSDIPSLPTSAHNNQSILLLSYFEQLSPEVQNIVLKERQRYPLFMGSLPHSTPLLILLLSFREA